MSRRRSRSHGLPTAVLAIVVILLGGALLASAGWVPVFIAVGAAVVLAFIPKGRRSRRRKSRR